MWPDDLQDKNWIWFACFNPLQGILMWPVYKIFDLEEAAESFNPLQGILMWPEKIKEQRNATVVEFQSLTGNSDVASYEKLFVPPKK